METNVVVALLVGLPGSGKTTLCRALRSYHEENQDCGKLMCVHVCYDDLIPLSVQRDFVEQKRTEGKEVEDEEWERNRNISNMKGSKNRKSTEEQKDREDSKSRRQNVGEDWKSARRKVHAQVDQFLQYIITGKAESEVDNFFNIPLEALETGIKYVILLDDNFYYRSMRYEFFQLARRHSAAFCQLYLECSTDEAEHHNATREERVPAGVVTAMGERLQAPQPHLHPWEANTWVMKTGGVDQVIQVWDIVFKSFQQGLTPLENRELEVAEARQCCSQSVVHQADLCLRAIVRRLVKEELQQACERSIPASQVTGCINAARQTLLADLRAGVEVVPPHLADVITQDNRQEFDAFLEAKMKKMLG